MSKIGKSIPTTRVNLLKRPARKAPTPFYYRVRREIGEFLSEIYPLVLERGFERTTVLCRDTLRMSDIPQMGREFLRIRHEELLILNFLDTFHPIAEEFDEYHQIPLESRERLVSGLKKIGLDCRDRQNVRYLLSKLARFSGLRHHDGSYNPMYFLAPLVACDMAGLVEAELNESESEALFYNGCEDISGAREHLRMWRDGNITPEQTERLAWAMCRMARMVYSAPPLFARWDQAVPPLCVFGEGQEISLPKEFLAAPSRFIEAQENVQGGKGFPKGLLDQALRAYDVSRLKRFELLDARGNTVPIISKRVEPLRVASIEEEVQKALEMADALRDGGMSNCRTAEYLGLVYDAGNFYILMRDEQAPSLWDYSRAAGEKVFLRIKRELSGGSHEDLEDRNALWNGSELVLIDFEGHATSAGVANIPPASNPLVYAALSKVDSSTGLRHELAPFKEKRKSVTRVPIVRRFRSALGLASRVRRGRPLPFNVAIGDIHGNVRRLGQILASPAVRRADRVVFLGDYFDRDRGGREVFKVLSTRLSRKDVFLLGNHEPPFMLAMKGDEDSFTDLLRYGGLSFLDTALDLGRLRRAYEAAVQELDEPTNVDIIEHLASENPDPLHEIHNEMRKNVFFEEVYSWLIAKGKLFYIDESGMLYIHAGIKADDRLGPDYFDGLKDAERSFISRMKSQTQNSLLAATNVAADFWHPLGMREDAWLGHFFGMGREKAEEVLFGMGIRGVVFAHTPRFRVANTFDRFWGIDLSMADHYGGIGGFLETGSEGVVSYRFAHGWESAALERQVLMEREAFQQRLQMDSDRMVKGFQEHFARQVF